VAGGGRLDDSAPRGAVATVFVTDPTAEAERVAQSLRGAGYAVVDVPLSMLVARVAVQHPCVILIDADSEGALEAVGRVRELPDALGIEVLFLARPGGVVASPEEAVTHHGKGLFVRPVEVAALVRKVEALTGGAGGYDDPPLPVSSSVPAPSSPGSSRRHSSAPPSLPPASMRVPLATTPPGEAKGVAPPLHTVASWPSRASSEPASSGVPPTRRMAGLSQPMSAELQDLLDAAEQRAQADVAPDSVVPSPEDEIEAVLPAELLAALDEPLEEDADDDEVARGRSLRSWTREKVDDHGGARSTGPAGAAGTSTMDGSARRTAARSISDERRVTPAAQYTHAGSTGPGVSTTGGSEARSPVDVEPPSPDGVASRRSPSLAPPAGWSHPQRGDPGARAADEGLPDVASPFPAVLAPGQASRVVARAIAARRSGSLLFVTPEAERRLVLREGDVVTLAASAEDESLLSFLGVRGDLPRETVRRLAPKFPPFGRHAGAALVAHGYLRQDQMWPTLRAHAEWLLARLLQVSRARLVLEPQPPARLAGEPGVFGGSTGAEVFVEMARRIVTPVDAVERLGGLGSRVSEGPESRLLEECALSRAEVEQVRSVAGRSLREVLEGAPDGDLATVVFALAELGVVEVMAAVGESERWLDAPGAMAGVAALDAEAIRERVRARMQLVDDGDYFAVLGVAREATGYEVRRAFLELRRAFEPSRLITPDIVDLADDVRKIAVVLEEAYEILKDAARRDRYRRAIEAVPGE
jgi:hypothetical protein